MARTTVDLLSFSALTKSLTMWLSNDFLISPLIQSPWIMLPRTHTCLQTWVLTRPQASFLLCFFSVSQLVAFGRFSTRQPNQQGPLKHGHFLILLVWPNSLHSDSGVSLGTKYSTSLGFGYPIRKNVRHPEQEPNPDDLS